MRIVSEGSAKAIYLDRDELFRELRKVVLELKKKPYVKEVRIFGSLAKGSYHGTSDVDLLVVVREEGRSLRSVWEELFDILSEELSLPFDLVVMDEESFRKEPHKYGKTLRV